MGKQNYDLPNLKVVVIGCTPLARHAIHAIKDVCEITGIMSLCPKKGATKSNYDSLKDLNGEFIVANTDDINFEMNWIKDKDPDIILQCGWSQIFKPRILEIPKKYCIGIHPSPLPVGRGAAIINWKIIESEGKTVPWGNSLFVMEAKTDTGAILDFEPFDIEPRDDIRTAYLKVNQTSVEMLKRTIPKIALNHITPKEQNSEYATRYHKRKPEDGEVFLNWGSTKVNDYVRALTHPYPGAFLNTKFGKLHIWETSLSFDASPVFNSIADDGKIWSVNGKGLLVQSGRSSLWIRRVSFGNSPEVWADDWAQTIGLQPGDNILHD